MVYSQYYKIKNKTMPELKTEGVLKIFVKKSFEKDGETVEYNTAYFLCGSEIGDETVVQVNTKQDLSDDLDKEGKITIRIGREGKLSLVSFVV